MSEGRPIDPLDELRRENPIASSDVPSANLARIRARVQEAIVLDADRLRDPPPGQPRRRLLGLSAGIALAALAFVAIVTRSGSIPSVVPGSADPGMASCVEQYSLDALANRDWAFDGTVTSTSGDEVTFTVLGTFLGTHSGTVTLSAPGLTGTTITSAGGPTLAVGMRYLVAGDDTFVWGCGFTQPYDSSVAAQWADKLGG